MILVEFLYEENLDTTYAGDRAEAYGICAFASEVEFESYLHTYAMLSRKRFEEDNDDPTDEEKQKVYYYSPYQDNVYFVFESFADFKSHFTILTSNEDVIDIMLNGRSYFPHMKGEFPRIELSGK